MQEIDPNAVYSRAEFRDLIQISKDKERELRNAGNYPRAAELGSRTTRILGRDIIKWLESNADSQGSDDEPESRKSA